MILETGLRTGEMIGLTWDAIDFQNRTLTVNKTLEYRHKQHFWRAGPPKTQQSYRTIPLTDRAYEILKGIWDSRPEQKESPTLDKTLEYIDRRTGVSSRLVMRDLVFINWRTGEPAKNSSYDTHLYKLCDEAGIKHYAGYCSFQNVCLGGLDRETGQDGVNELTYLMLKATIDLQMVQPSVSVRLSKKNPEDYFLKIAELVGTGSGFPAIYNEEVGLKMLMKKGVPLEKAWDWSCIGCVEPLMPGKTSQWSSAGHYNLAAAVEFVLTNGVHRKSGKRIGLETGDPETFASYEMFKAAVYAQLDRLIRQFSISQNLIERLQQQFFPNPLISMSILDCVENGRDLMHGGARYNVGPGMNGNGVADFADSLIAVKKLVYDEKRLPMHTLLEALAADFQGYEAVERMLTEDAPKWGNDDPDVDAVVMELCDFIIKIHAELKGILGNPKMPALYPVSSNVPQGLSIGALPSGRRAGKPLADGCSPSQGCDRFGPTAILRSLDKMPHACLDGGTLLNLWLTPAVVQGEEGGHRLSAFLKTFLDMDIFHIQFNVVGQDILRCAQERPEEYRSLLVRVAGYSAYFVELSREVQDDILSRTVNTL